MQATAWINSLQTKKEALGVFFPGNETQSWILIARRFITLVWLWNCIAFSRLTLFFLPRANIQQR